MRLSGYTGENNIENAAASRPQAQPASVGRQIQSLVPGQTIHGEILSRNGSEVQIRLADDMVLNARVDQSIYLETGKDVTFEIKNNGSALTLSPLFTNISTDVNVLKALDMARLPINSTTVSMTEQLMKAGLPVNRNSLQQIFREINSFPQAEVGDVVNLHRLGMPVNQANIDQMISYRNLTYQLTDAMNTVLEAIPEAAEAMLAEGNIQGAAGLYQELFQMLQEGITDLPPGAETDGGQSGAAEGAVPGSEELLAGGMTPEEETAALKEAVALEKDVALQEVLDLGNLGESTKAEDGIQKGQTLTAAGESPEAEAAGRAPESAKEGSGEKIQMDPEMQKKLAESMLKALEEMQADPEKTQGLRQILGQSQPPAPGELLEAARQLLNEARHLAGGAAALRKLFSGKEFHELLTGRLKESWTLRPEEVSSRENVEKLYRRLDTQLKNLSQALEAGGQTGGGAYKAVTSMAQNVDFLQQLNQMYAYVQLPLRLNGSEAHGDLYVYTNRRNLAGKDGKISALLHLDMKHLGPVDVYVALQNTKVSTKFYVRDENMLDFLADHMDLLTGRLQKRGYDCSFSMTTRGEQTEKDSVGGLAPLLEQEKGIMLSQYAFDVRT